MAEPQVIGCGPLQLVLTKLDKGDVEVRIMGAPKTRHGSSLGEGVVDCRVVVFAHDLRESLILLEKGDG